MSKRLSIKRRTLVTASVCILIGLLIGFSYSALAQSPTLSTATITGGPIAGAPTYTVFPEGGYYYAKDSNGAIDYGPSTNESSILQSIITICDSVNIFPVIYLKSGIHVFNYSILVDQLNGFELYGDGQNTAIHFSNVDLLSFTGDVYRIYIHDLYISCESASGSFVVNTYGFEAARFRNLHVWNAAAYRDTFFNLTGGGATNYEVTFTDCTINFGEYLIWYVGSELSLTNCKFGGSPGYGKTSIVLGIGGDTGNAQVTGCGFEAVSLQLIQSFNVVVNGNWWTNGYDSGVYGYETKNCSITDNIIEVLNGANPYGILLFSETTNCQNNIVSGNIARGADIGIYETGPLSNNNTFSDNDCSLSTVGIVTNGTRTHVQNCWNGTKWIGALKTMILTFRCDPGLTDMLIAVVNASNDYQDKINIVAIAGDLCYAPEVGKSVAITLTYQDGVGGYTKTISGTNKHVDFDVADGGVNWDGRSSTLVISYTSTAGSFGGALGYSPGTVTIQYY